jgi:NodT family efflux transporter outer membrane factor (OMF) lipoprotein
MRRIVCLGLSLSLAACAVGPDFERPAPPAGQSYTAAPLPAQTIAADGHAQSFAIGQDIPAQWWGLFHSDKLDALVAKAIADNPSLASARAALRQSHELTEAARTAFFPLLSGQLSQLRGKNAQNSIAPPTQSVDPYYSLYTAQLSLSYSPDIWGATRRAVEASEATENATRFQVEATYLTLSSSVVVTVIEEASLRAQLDATRRLIAIAHELTGKLESQRAIGMASELDVLAQRAAEAQLAETLAPLEKQLAQSRDALAALLGVTPAELADDPVTLDELTLPEQLPVSLPSKLVEQRPDVRQAEENLHVVTAEIGIAIADMLPQFDITGSLGSGAYRPSQLFTPGNGFWSIGTSLTQTLFDAGALLHKRRAADAALDQAGADYRMAVLTAIQNVADSLEAVKSDGDGLKATAEAEQAAKKSWDLAKRQRDIGMINLVMLLNAEQTYQQAEIALVGARAARLSDTAGLFQALGGGWWNRAEEGERK